MIERLFGIQYTGSIPGTIYGYYLDGQGRAIVHAITPTGRVPLGTCPAPFPHADAVRRHVTTTTTTAGN